MSTAIRCRTSLPYPPSRAWDLLADATVVQGRTGDHEALVASVLGHRVELAHGLTGPSPASIPVVSIETAGTVPTHWLPPILAAYAAGRMPAVHRCETWRRISEDRLDGDMVFTIRGVDAASASGSMRVRGTATGSEMYQEVIIAAGVPLFGGLIERSLAGRIHESLAAESKYLAQR